MAICETCGSNYQPTPEALDCPKCAAQPKPQVRKKPAEAQAAPASGPRRIVPGGAGPGGAGPAGAVPAKSPAVARKPGPAPVQRASAAPPKPAPAPAPARLRLEPGEKPSPLDQTTKIGLLITAGFGVIVLLVVMFVARKRADEKRDREARDAEVQAVLDSLAKLDVKSPAEAERILKATSDKEPVWRTHASAADIQSAITRAKNGLSAAKEQNQALATLDEIEKELERPEVLASRLRDLRRQLEESEGKLAAGGPELVARLTIARRKADETYAIRLLDEAKSTAAGGGSARPGLVRYQTVEDELKSLLDKAFFQKNEEQKAFYTPLYKRAVEEGDALATGLFTAEGDKLAWTDCLVPPQKGYWNPSPGLSHTVDNGVLLLEGPDPGSNSQAVISIGDREQWRHFQLDLAFQIEKGNLDLAFRLGKGVNPNTLSYPLWTSGENARLRAGKAYSARISVIGSHLDVRYAGEDIDTPAPFEQDVSWTMGRKGAIGLVVSPDARARFTRFQVRELR